MADNQKLLKVRVRDVEKVLFDGTSDRVSSFNEVGPFDVYIMHANFISILRKQVILYLQGKILIDLKFEQAVMKVKDDEVKIFLGVEAMQVEEAMNK